MRLVSGRVEREELARERVPQWSCLKPSCIGDRSTLRSVEKALRWNHYSDGQEELAVKQVVGNSLRYLTSVKVAWEWAVSLTNVSYRLPVVIVMQAAQHRAG